MQVSHSLYTGPSPCAPEIGHLIPVWRVVPSSLRAGFIDLFILMGGDNGRGNGETLAKEEAAERLEKNPGLTRSPGVWFPSFPISYQQVAIFVLHLSYLTRGHVCLQGKD